MAAQFVSFRSPVAADNAFGEKPVGHKAFATKFSTMPDVISEPMTIDGIQADRQARVIRVLGSDNLVRVCRVDRLVGGTEAANNLYRRLKEAGTAGTLVTLKAAGGFSTDNWFYDFDEVKTSKKRSASSTAKK